jgi:hypothetical protein
MALAVLIGVCAGGYALVILAFDAVINIAT